MLSFISNWNPPFVIRLTIFDTLESINHLLWAMDKLMQRLNSSAICNHSHEQLKASSQLGNG